ncbi:MAG: PH domain-containing protein [Phycisphaeraceae bacterium]
MPTTQNNPKLAPRRSERVEWAHRAEDATHDPHDDVVAARAAAMLPAELLQPHEIIVLLLKPSPWFIVLAPLKTLVALVVLTLAMVVLSGHIHAWLGIAQRDLVLIGVALIGVRLFWQFLEWLSRVYVMTDQRLIRVRGVLRVQVFECQLRQVQHTEVLLSIRERLFGLGTIVFATAGTALSEAHWQMVARPLEVHQRVVQTLRRYRR